ncbi:MAG TPA: hypothetical protein VFU64_08680 [Gaiellaceae bacterium]|nr:hypothetical protein [Gaiellaceae bacterium]
MASCRSHTTGYAFDLGRGSLTLPQVHALRWVLNRPTALDAVAYIEEPYCVHVAVASRANRELGLLRRTL